MLSTMLNGRSWMPIATLLVLALPGSAQAISDQEVLAHVNDVRARMGLAALAWDRERSEGCRSHGTYLSLNPGEYVSRPHDQVARLRGATPAGRRAAATSGLNRGELGFGGDSVYGYRAPWHNMLVFAPDWTTLHRGFQDGYDCIGGGTDGFTSAADVQPNRLWVWPPSGSTTVAPSVRHFEAPYAPPRVLGLPDDAETGPSFYVYGRPTLRLACAAEQSVKLVGPAGRVALNVIDSQSRGPSGEPPHLYGGIVATVRAPLAPSTRYTLTARFVVPDSCPADGPAIERAAPPVTFTTAPPALSGAAAAATSAPPGMAFARRRTCAPSLHVTPSPVTVARLQQPGLRVRYCGRGTLILAPATPASVRQRLGLPKTLYATRTAGQSAHRIMRVRVRKGLLSLWRQAPVTLLMRLATRGGWVSRTVTVVR